MLAGVQTERAYQKQQNIRAGYVFTLTVVVVVGCTFCKLGLAAGLFSRS